ncbi:nitroreductase family protein [Acetonema longum]|uniref:Nitroreductase family protein n=1 Tax=Acetonema longum DSM 6540 TaxID=1009370 RepID=F7NFT0_9FIRM|nr:nitroreductase family protein [Acetonema longum]EGO65107.1 nitroreductase family protein [Acetonema longum DSM 6540]
MEKSFFTAVKARRSYYGISKESVITEESLTEIVNNAVQYTPSAFNSQSARVVLLLGEQHTKLWDMTENELKKLVPADKFAPTAEKINSFRNGCGSVLFFEDLSVIEGLQSQFPLYKANFPIWSHHASGMLQHVIWVGLEEAGLGASLQHYNPLIDAEVKQTWHIPDKWQLIAQMPFGKPTAEPEAKDFQPLSDRVRIYK